MTLQLHRSQSNVLVGTNDTLLIGPNPRRWAILVSPLQSAVNEVQSHNTFVHNASIAATGVVLSYTAPGGVQATLEYASYFLTAGAAATLNLQYVSGATTINLESGSANFQQNFNLPITPGDKVQWNVTVLGAAGTADFMLGIAQNSFSDAQFTLGNTIWLSFNQTAAVNVGIPRNPSDPGLLLLYDHVGQAIREEIRAIASTIQLQVGILDIFEVDCPCTDPYTQVMDYNYLQYGHQARRPEPFAVNRTANPPNVIKR